MKTKFYSETTGKNSERQIQTFFKPAVALILKIEIAFTQKHRHAKSVRWGKRSNPVVNRTHNIHVHSTALKKRKKIS